MKYDTMKSGKNSPCKGGIPLKDQIQYKRVLLKVSGEALAGDAHRGLDFDVIGQVCAVIKRCVEAGVQVGVVVGGGNFWRGIKDGGDRMQRVRADHMGMLATVINALAVADRLEQQGVPARVMTAIDMPRIAEPYIRDKAVSHLEKGRVVVFGCGTGNPFFSTDTGAVLKAVEIGADAILLAKNIDGVYSADPASPLTRSWPVGWGSWTPQPPALPWTTICPSSSSRSRIRRTSTGWSPERSWGRLSRTNNKEEAKMAVDFKEFTRKMERTLEVLQEDFGAIRAGRANARVLDRITVPYYGVDTPLGQVASISSPDPRTLMIQPWDGSLLKPMEKALQASDLGINPQNDGRVIRLIFPQLTEERRKELTKQVKNLGEGSKVAVRNLRREAMDAIKKLKKNSEITEDEQKEAEKDLQDLTDKYIKKVDEACAVKEKELMEL